MKKQQICYNCGNPIDEKELTKEHVPAKNLFEGYDEKYKVNRITVAACLKCNGEYSPTDEDFRNMIGAIAKRKENNAIAEKTKRSLLRKDPQKQTFSIDNIGKISGITLNEITVEQYHKKNFKALFFDKYGRAIDENEYDIFVNIDENDWSHATLGILGYLKDLFKRFKSGHEDILNYSLQPFRLGVTNPSQDDLQPDENENMFVGFFEYNKEHASLVIAVRKGYLEELKIKRAGNK